MKKNNKGFFLAETIIVVALVTTVMAFVYPNVTKLYDNYKNRSLYYDQTEDLYNLKALSEANIDVIVMAVNNYNVNTDGLKQINLENNLGFSKLYIAKYMGEYSSDDYNFKKYLKRLKKVNNDENAYRLIGIIDNGSGGKHYASIKLELESLYRNIYKIPVLKYSAAQSEYVVLTGITGCKLINNGTDPNVKAIYNNEACSIIGIKSGESILELKIGSGEKEKTIETKVTVIN